MDEIGGGEILSMQAERHVMDDADVFPLATLGYRTFSTLQEVEGLCAGCHSQEHGG